MDEQRRAVLRWRVKAAWLNKLETGGFKASASEVLIETAELVHEGLQMEAVG
jgi:phage tail-like protein